MQLLLCLLLLLAPHVAAADNGDFLTTLIDKHRDYQWDVKRVISVDLNRDGKPDSAAFRSTEK